MGQLSRRHDVPVDGTSAAMVSALHTLGVERLQLVHPPWFGPEMNELGAAYFRHAGFEVVATASADLPDDPVVVEGWEPGLRLLVSNLVTNAVRHGRPGGEVRVTLRGAHDGHGPVLHVDDDGQGVPVAERERIFEPFARGRSDEGGPGTGLGLAIARGFTQLNGGRLWIESGPDAGTTFALALPATKVPTTAAR